MSENHRGIFGLTLLMYIMGSPLQFIMLISAVEHQCH